MNKILHLATILILIIVSGCASILDDYHRHTGVYLPYKIGELGLCKDIEFDKEGRDVGYFYQNFNKENFVTSIIYIYPISDSVRGENAIAEELTTRYPKLEQKGCFFKQGTAQPKGKCISFTDTRGFANKKNQTVRNIVYLTALGDDWFFKFHCAYQDSIAKTAQPVVDRFLMDFFQNLEIRKNDYL